MLTWIDYKVLAALKFLGHAFAHEIYTYIRDSVDKKSDIDRIPSTRDLISILMELYDKSEISYDRNSRKFSLSQKHIKIEFPICPKSRKINQNA